VTQSWNTYSTRRTEEEELTLPIIVSEGGRNARRLEPSGFELEDHLQEYIFRNPDVIPLEDLEVGTRLFIAAREFLTPSGPIDALAFDATGNIYVVETKLYRNSDKRTVVAQALDYGASLWRHTTAFADFVARLDRSCLATFGLPFTQKYAEFFGLDDASESVAAIESNLSEGRIKFVILMDKVHQALLDLIVFVNQNSKFDLYGVELEYYRHESFEIVIPRLFGGEVKKDLESKARKRGPQWIPTTEDEFAQLVAAFHESGDLQDEGQSAILSLADLYRELAPMTDGTVAYWRVVGGARDTVKLTLSDHDRHYSIALGADGRWEAFTNTKRGPQIEFLNAVLTEVERHGLFGRSPLDQRRIQWTVHLDAVAAESSINEFVDINRRALALLSEPDDAS
jgi:hypothetical protein